MQAGDEVIEPNPLDVWLTARWGLHHEVAGRAIWTPNEHEPWPLRSADVLAISDELVHAAGFEVSGPPPVPARFTSGVHTRFGWPRVMGSGPTR